MKNLRRHTLAIICIGLFVLGMGFHLDRYGSVPVQEPLFELRTFKKEDGLWCYEIYEDGQLLIRQEQLPAVRGVQYFRSQKDARQTAKLVLQKLREQQTPSITIGELKEHGITFKE